MEEVRVVLKLLLPDEGEAEALLSALAADDWRENGVGILTSRRGMFVEVEAYCSRVSVVAKARSLIDDVLRVVRALEQAREKLK